MKKLVIVFVFVLSSGVNKASHLSHVAHIEKDQKHQHSHCVDGNQSTDEYTTNQCDIDEYDQHICDDVKPPKISDAQIFLTNIVGKLLVQYFIMQHTASIYFHELKDILNQWFNSIIKQ